MPATLTDPNLAALHAATNGYLINLSPQVQLGDNDKLEDLWCSTFISMNRKDEQAIGGIKVIRLKKKIAYRCKAIMLLILQMGEGDTFLNMHRCVKVNGLKSYNLSLPCSFDINNQHQKYYIF